jgi:hypothetical protein
MRVLGRKIKRIKKKKEAIELNNKNFVHNNIIIKI